MFPGTPHDCCRRVIWLAGLALIMSSSELLLAEASVERGAAPKEIVVFCPVEGDIFDGVAVVVERAVTRESQGAKAIVFVIDTFGGRVDSAIEIAQTILEAPAPTIAYVTGRGAISAGALIAYACDHIVMAPGASIGASTPIVPGVEMSEQMNEKSMSFLRAKYRALGEEKGHNPLIGEAMVDPSIELHGLRGSDGVYRVYKVADGRVVESFGNIPSRPDPRIGTHEISVFGRAQPGVDDAVREIQETLRDIFDLPSSPSDSTLPQEESPSSDAGRSASVTELPEAARVISPEGKLLTLTTGEAMEIGLAEHTADTPEDGVYFLGYGPYIAVHIEMTWAEKVFAFLSSPMIAGLLLLCGVGGLYVEFRTPGIGWPGIIGAICLTLFFGARLIIGIADWLDILLVTVGLILLTVEVFVLPGFGLAGISGIVCLVAGIYLSLTRVPIPQYTWDFMRLRDAGVTLMSATLLFILFTALTWKIFPRTRLARGLMLADAQTVEAGYVVQTAADAGNAVGLRGKAVSMLRPAGRGRFGQTTYDVMTRGEFIEKGCSIEIIQAEGNRYVVREIAE